MEVSPEVPPPGDRPLCVIDHSVAVDQVEADLRYALFASVGGARPLVSADQVWQAIAQFQRCLRGHGGSRCRT
jgi:hypothetical protein